MLTDFKASGGIAQTLMAKSAKSIPVSGPKLTDLRDELGHTQESFARMIGMTRSGIARIEGLAATGMSKTKFRTLAEYLKMDVSELRGRIGAPVAKATEGRGGNDVKPPGKHKGRYNVVELPTPPPQRPKP